MRPQRLNRADFITAIVLIVLGIAIVYGSWTMPRLENRGIHPSSVPGLVPGILGFALAVCGGILALRSRPGRGSGAAAEGASFNYDRPQLLRPGITAALTLIYALVLVGTLPFWLATAIFVLAFIVIFERMADETRQRSFPRMLVMALIQAVIVGAATHLIFEELFLVRLP